MTKLLAGFSVIESSMLLNGATLGMMLADLGADVIKVESPFLGDYLRIDDTWHMHAQTNKNKRSLALDLRHPSAREVFQRLLATADVFITNAVANRNDKLGLGYEQLKQHKPDIVYCQHTGFGAAGPYAEIPAHGQMMDTLAGAFPVEMGDDGLTRPRAIVRRAGTMASAGEGTATGSVYAAMHVAAALAHRERTGEGCYIDVSAAEAVIANAWVAASRQLNRSEETVQQRNEGQRGVARYQWYQTKDGSFVLFCPEENKFWHAFCELIDRPDLMDKIYGVDLRHEVQQVFWTKTRSEWMDIAISHRLPIGPANDGIKEVRADPHLRARPIFIDGTDPRNHPFTYIGQPAIIDGQSADVVRHAPELGEHTTEILHQLGYDNGDIERLAADHITTAVSFDHDHIAIVQPTFPKPS